MNKTRKSITLRSKTFLEETTTKIRKATMKTRKTKFEDKGNFIT